MGKEKLRKIWGGLAVVSVFATGFIFGKLESIKSTVAIQPGAAKEERGADYTKQWNFINPLLDCGSLESVSNQNIMQMKKDINDFIDTQKIRGTSKVSVYFRDLNNGPWLGINERDEFNPGSLLKVPMMMRILKDMEIDPSILEQKVLIKEQANPLVQYYKPEVTLETGKQFTVSELISNMIVYSNNDATKAIEQFIGPDRLYKTYEELGVKKPVDGNYTISVRGYASFFRVLYNASYLNDNYSEQALKLLAASTFDKGLKAGVPTSTVVAHKFGERKVNSITKQLHDCGIVYHPDKPYILCVMTRGDDFDKLSSVIAEISRVVYNRVSQENN